MLTEGNDLTAAIDQPYGNDLATMAGRIEGLHIESPPGIVSPEMPSMPSESFKSHERGFWCNLQTPPLSPHPPTRVDELRTTAF
mgnify:CR=1 FL=1